MKNNFFLLALLAISISCSSQKQEKNPEYPYKDYITETKKMPFSNNDFYYQFTKQVFTINTNCYLSILNLKKNQLTIFEIPTFELVYQKDNIDFGGIVAAIDIHNFDTIYVIINKTLVQTDTSYKVVNKWTIDPISQEYGNDYYIGKPLHVDEPYFYVGHYPNHALVTKQRRTTYFSKHHIIKLSFCKSDTILNYYGKFPDVYLKHNYDLDLCRFTIKDSFIITSFKETDSIYINNKAIASVRSNYFTKNKEKDISKINDTEYNNKRATENCRYGPLLYNPYTKHYYRMFHFATNYRNKDGTINSPDNAKKSIIVTDTNFHVLKEIVLPPEYFIYDSYITPKGLMIKRENKNDKKNIYFDFFNL
ncbi:MAG: DUF4221 domain-containing protein [Bacteroidales bacterium]|nr:DUF4221 domain-containing protein [Bacteroidales bacterium]